MVVISGVRNPEPFGEHYKTWGFVSTICEGVPKKEKIGADSLPGEAPYHVVEKSHWVGQTNPCGIMFKQLLVALSR